MRYLLDTNIVLEHLKTSILDRLTENDIISISVITEAEIFRYGGLGKNELEVIGLFLSEVEIIPIDSSIARRAALLGRTRKTKLPDLLIAASAIEADAVLITQNLKDFKGIPGLRVRGYV